LGIGETREARAKRWEWRRPGGREDEKSEMREMEGKGKGRREKGRPKRTGKARRD
jgi:hypothetical protein